MPQNAASQRYEKEAEFALSRLRVSRAAGDAARAEEWHRAWSLATAAAEAEQAQAGAGVQLARRRTPPPLRPLPPDVPPLKRPHPALDAGPPADLPLSEPEADPLDVALERHARIERALQTGGPNPLPEEFTEEEWQYQLTAYRVGGPLDCELLQAAEDAVERIVESRPEFWVGAEESATSFTPATDPTPEAAIFPVCLQIYRESLPDLSEAELRADLETCLADGRAEAAALIETELAQREQATAPDWPSGRSVRESQGPGSVADKGAAVAAGPARPQSRGAKSVDRRPGTRASQRPQPPAAETTNSGYSTAPDWVDTAGRTRTWSLLDPSGAKVAEIATRRDAEKLADLLNRLMPAEGRASPAGAVPRTEQQPRHGARAVTADLQPADGQPGERRATPRD